MQNLLLLSAKDWERLEYEQKSELTFLGDKTDNCQPKSGKDRSYVCREIKNLIFTEFSKQNNLSSTKIFIISSTLLPH